MSETSENQEARAGCAPLGGSASGETLDEWKARHGIDPKRVVNQDELLMSVEESRSKEKSWCLGCDKHMPVREMNLITRSTDPYVQIDEGETDYIAKTNRIRMCPVCYKERYEAED
jgi:hypothetical protein